MKSFKDEVKKYIEINEVKEMKLKDVFNIQLDEMARADLSDSLDAIKSSDWAGAAKKYVEAAKKRGLDDAKIISGLGATFRAKAGSDEIIVGKKEGTDVTIAKGDVPTFKKAVKEFLGFISAADKKKSESAKKKEAKAAAKAEKSKEEKTSEVKEEIFRNIRYIEGTRK